MKFTWNPDLYDSKHFYVSEYGLDILKLLNPQNDEAILDLGCGTGDLTARVADISGAVVGVDSSLDMIKKAREKFPSVEFITGDARDFFIDSVFDAVFSNAVLHWVPDAEAAIRNINRHLKSGGRFVAEFGGKGCIQKILTEIVKVLNEKEIGYPEISEALYYPSIGEYSAILEKNGFEVAYAALFDRPTQLKGGYEGLTNFIRMFHQWIFAEACPEETASIIDTVSKRLEREMFINNSWVADYRRIQIVAIKIEGIIGIGD